MHLPVIFAAEDLSDSGIAGSHDHLNMCEKGWVLASEKSFNRGR
jgi:hypothetical protein